MTTSIACQSILFDLDGTLVDTAPDLVAALNYVLRNCGVATVDLEKVKELVGGGARMLLARALYQSNIPPQNNSFFEQATQMFLDYYSEHLLDQSQPFPLVAETLATLHAQGYKMAVVTNKPVQFSHQLLAGLSLAPYFHYIIGGDSLEERKPHPLPLVHTLNQLQSQQGVMVGDSHTDIEAARAAQMPVIAVSYGYNQGVAIASLCPDRTIHSFGELPSHLTLSPAF